MPAPGVSILTPANNATVSSSPGVTGAQCQTEGVAAGDVTDVRVWSGSPNDTPTFEMAFPYWRNVSDGTKWDGMVSTMMAGQIKMKPYMTYKVVVDGATHTITVTSP